MNHIANEMNDILIHYGMPKRSGRYPWGSGDDPYQRNRDFLSRIEELKKTGWTETPENIKKEFGVSTTQYRSQKALAKSGRRMLEVARAKSLREDGLGNTEIGRAMGLSESTVRSLLSEKSEARMNQAKNTSEFIKKQVEEKGMIDVGTGVERELNISREKMDQALAILQAEGYPIYKGRVAQATNKGQFTTIKVIAPPGTEHKEIYNFDKINSLKEYVSHDDGETFNTLSYPKSLDSNRVKIRYAEEGGIDKDGIVEIRRGVDDISLGNSRYAQVRILVDDKKYIKGMAIYSDDMPDGVDVVFNTNKKAGTDKMDVLKNIKDDPDNPFGSLIKAGGQSYYIDKNGNKQLSVINKTREEGDWNDWKDALPSQFLAKQSINMAKKQLNLAAADKTAELDEIMSLTNPTVKKHFLQSFSEDCDSAAVHLQAAALPGQKHHVIIPITSMKDNEVYAPGYDNGTELALIRYPHAGTFEIPILKVNNKHPVANKLLGKDIVDAVGINSKVAERLSGADFDGDTVMCIPTNDKAGKVKITSTRALKGLEGFDPKMAYGPDTYAGQKVNLMSPVQKQRQMGIISNLITDMTLKGADEHELAAAVRHSMVVIDAEKHKLNYKQSELDNNISALKKTYQRKIDANGNVRYGGASTLISRAKGEVDVLKRQGNPIIDPITGKQTYKIADDVAYDVKKINKKTGAITTETRYKHQKSTRMAETDDAYSLVSDANNPMERLYADYANKMKSLANRARKEMLSSGKVQYSDTARKVYSEEVSSLLSKLNTALLNSPRERQAQLKANATVASKISSRKTEGVEMTPEEIRKANTQALNKYRVQVGAVSRNDRSIKISDREWEAIQAGAISETQLKKILANTDADVLRQKATPRTTTQLSTAKINRIKSLSASNYTLAEIANKLGVSTSTVNNYLKGES